MKKVRLMDKFINLIQQSQGMSLIEVVVTITILGIIVVPFTNMFLVAVKNNNDVERKMEAYSIASNYMEQAKVENITIKNNRFTLWGQEWHLSSGSFHEIIQEDNRYRVFGKFEKAYLPGVWESQAVANLKIIIKVTDSKEDKTWIQLESNVIGNISS